MMHSTKALFVLLTTLFICLVCAAEVGSRSTVTKNHYRFKWDSPLVFQPVPVGSGCGDRYTEAHAHQNEA
jgi:hypothetical protein